MDVDLTGIVDLHLHSAPDVRLRLYDDIELARAAAQAGLRAIMLKSHVTITADRATIAEKVVPGIRVFGGLALNSAVGGLNPAAVEAAIKLGAKQIWMPTSSAAHDVAYFRSRGGPPLPGDGSGITILDENGSLLQSVREIIDLVAHADIILSTAHLAPKEVVRLVEAARSHGLRRLLVTHPEHAISRVPLEVQRTLVQPGVWFEHCYACTLFSEPIPLAEIAARIRAIGAEHIVLSTDLGIVGLPSPVDGMRAYLSGLLELGIPWKDLRTMARDNPAHLLDLG